MSTATAPLRASRPGAQPERSRRIGRWIPVILAVLALILVVAGTKVVKDGEGGPAAAAAFSKETYGAENFPAIRDAIVESAVPAPELAAAIAADPAAAASEHGVDAAGMTVYSTTATGTVQECASGICTLQVEGVPEDFTVRVQVGPAVNGTDLRDATGTIDFGQFTNQIEYQDAGAALNDEMKKQVLEGIDPTTLTGKTVTVTGAFTAINPTGWLITPVELEAR